MRIINRLAVAKEVVSARGHSRRRPHCCQQTNCRHQQQSPRDHLQVSCSRQRVWSGFGAERHENLGSFCVANVCYCGSTTSTIVKNIRQLEFVLPDKSLHDCDEISNMSREYFRHHSHFDRRRHEAAPENPGFIQRSVLSSALILFQAHRNSLDCRIDGEQLWRYFLRCLV